MVGRWGAAALVLRNVLHPAYHSGGFTHYARLATALLDSLRAAVKQNVSSTENTEGDGGNERNWLVRV